MKILWIVACWMTVVHCGVVPWSQSKEDEAIHLFRSYCLNNADKGVSGNVKWFCKKPTNYLPEQTFEHYKVITARPHNQKQVIFVQTPSRTYKHNVYVKGEADFNQDTHIYVVPGQDRHHVDIQGNIETKSGNGGKPHTFYLQKNPLELADDKYPDHNHHHHHNDPYSPAYKPSHPDTYGSHTPAQPTHDHYPSYTHTSPRFEFPPEDLDTSPKVELPRSQEVSTQIGYRRPQEESPASFDYRPPEVDDSRFEYRRPQDETSRRFDYRQTQEEVSPRYNYRPPPQFDTPPYFPNHIRQRRRHFEHDFVTPHPDTVKKFSGFRNF